MGETVNCHKKLKKEVVKKNNPSNKWKPKSVGASHCCCDVESKSSSCWKNLSHCSLGKGSCQGLLKVVLVLGCIFLEVPLLWVLERCTFVAIKSVLTWDKYSVAGTEDWKCAYHGKLVEISGPSGISRP